MYTLQEAWKKMYGTNPIEDWDGHIYCVETDADTTYRTNHTHGYIAAYTFTLVTEGWLTIIYNGRQLTLHPDDLYIYSPGLPVTVLAAADDYHGICLLADERTTLESSTVHNLIHIAYAPIVQLHEPKMTLPHVDAIRLADRMYEVIQCLHAPHTYKVEVLRLRYALFLLDLHDAQNRMIPHRIVPQRVEDLFVEFLRLLPLHFAQHHDIAFYASALNISSVYLSRIVRQVIGRTVSDYINQMLFMEASFLLRHSTLSVAQISDRLSFSEPASFSRFFNRMSGRTPREFRNHTKKVIGEAIF